MRLHPAKLHSQKIYYIFTLYIQCVTAACRDRHDKDALTKSQQIIHHYCTTRPATRVDRRSFFSSFRSAFDVTASDDTDSSALRGPPPQ